MKYTTDEIERIVADWSQCDQLDKMIKRIALYSAPDKDGWYDKYGTRVVNEVFEMHPYCWGGQPEHPEGTSASEMGPEAGPFECPLCNETLPNFWHKPTGLKVWWYKYIGRGRIVESPGRPRSDSDAHFEKGKAMIGLDPEQLGQIERDCINAILLK